MSDHDNDHKLTVVGADWCGWTKRQMETISTSAHAPAFEYVDCSKDPDNKYCKDVTGYPVIKNSSGDVCHRGFMDANSPDFAEMMKKCKA